MSVNSKSKSINMVYHTMESYTAKNIKKIHTITWMNLINITLNEKRYKNNAI